MHFTIDHTTRYQYSQPVFLEPQLIRLRPRCDVSQRLLTYQLHIDPAPVGCSEGLDLENNSMTCCWFEGLHPALEVKVTLQVETLCSNPFAGLLLNQSDHLPWTPTAAEQAVLAPALDTHSPDLQHPTLVSLAQEWLTQDSSTLAFLNLVNTRLHEAVKKQERHLPGIQPPHVTWQRQQGACRDLAWLFMALCRHVGLASRFVSGYHQGDTHEPDRQLHAWAEVYLPGLGWRGYDPTHGLAVADRHVVLASAAQPEHTMPLTGSFRADHANAELTHSIAMKIDKAITDI